MSTQWNLLNLRSEIKARLKNASLTNASVDRWINDAQDRLYREIDFDHKNRPISFDTVASQREYYIECSYRRIKNIVDQDTNVTLDEVSVNDIENSDPDQSTTGNPYCYAVEGIYEVKAQPETAGNLTVVSSSASDASQTVKVIGEDASGDTVSPTSVSLNGTTSVAITGSFTTVIRFRVSASTVGDITLKDSDGNILGVIQPNKLRTQYIRLILAPIPSGANTLNIYALQLPWSLEYVEDVPDLPEEWWGLVLEMAVETGHLNLYEFEAADKIKERNTAEILRLKQQQGNSRNQARKRRVENLSSSSGITGYPFKIG